MPAAAKPSAHPPPRLTLVAVAMSSQHAYVCDQADESVAEEEEELFAVGPGTADGTPARGQGSAAADGQGSKVTSPAADPEASLLSDNEQADALLDVSPAVANGTSAGAQHTGPAGGASHNFRPDVPCRCPLASFHWLHLCAKRSSCLQLRCMCGRLCRTLWEICWVSATLLLQQLPRQRQRHRRCGCSSSPARTSRRLSFSSCGRGCRRRRRSRRRCSPAPCQRRRPITWCDACSSPQTHHVWLPTVHIILDLRFMAACIHASYDVLVML